MAHNETSKKAEDVEILKLSAVTKSFGRFHAVHDVSFSVKAGEVVGFVGVNGAGKTTTISMILGFTSPSKGEVTLFGERVRPLEAHVSHRKIGYAAGDMELPGHLTGKQYLDFVLAQSSGDYETNLNELLHKFKPQLTKKIKTLSRGNKQKIALVAAFMCNPQLVVLDEPTSGLDPIMQSVFLELIERERSKGVTIFMSSHYLQEVAEVCTRVILMKDGEIVKDISTEDIERASGKTVRIVAGSSIVLPEKNIRAQATRGDDASHYEATFVYSGNAKDLLSWLESVKDVRDFEVNERTLEAEFRTLYANENGEEDL